MKTETETPKTDYELFKHMSDTYKLTLTGSEMHEIRIAAGLVEIESASTNLRKTMGKIYLALGTNEADCEKWPEAISGMRDENDRLRNGIRKARLIFDYVDSEPVQECQNEWAHILEESK